MGLSPRKRGQAAVRARHSRYTRTIFSRLEPFFAVEAVSGGPLLIATILALVWVNSPLSASYHAVWSTKLSVTLGAMSLNKSLAEWASDALLPVFFFGVGIEVKRELVKGLLSDRRTAMLPLACAIGGMAVPAALYAAFNFGSAFAKGWGVTVTTDTAFAMALLGMFAARLPRSIRVLLLAFAAVDDIGGLLVIAFVYTQHVNWLLLGIAVALYVLIIALRRFEIIASVPYVLLGIAILILVGQSGVHATIAGVALGALVPVQPRMPESRFAEVVQKQVDRFQSAHRRLSEEDESLDRADDAAEHSDHPNHAPLDESERLSRLEKRERAQQEAQNQQEAQLGKLSETAHATYETAQRVTHGINPWISYVVLPLFALSNAGVTLSPDALRHALSNTVALGIVVGLVIGKPIGIMLFAYLASVSGIAIRPAGVTWRMLTAVAISAGIGFTISLFIADLAFAANAASEDAKLGVLMASALSGMAGFLAFRWAADGRIVPPLSSGESDGVGKKALKKAPKKALGDREGDEVADYRHPSSEA